MVGRKEYERSVLCICCFAFWARTAELRLPRHVHRLVLSVSSPVFETMLSLPQPHEMSLAGSTPPVIDVTEERGTINSFLRILYGTSLIIPWCYRCHTLGRFRPQGPSTRCLWWRARWLRRRRRPAPDFWSRCHSKCLQSPACLTLKLEGQAQDAAKKAVQKKPITNLPHSPELDKLCASSYHRLISLSETNIQQASGLANRQDRRP